MSLVNLLRRISLKHIKHQKARTIMAMLGIVLGVASMTSIGIVNKSVLRSFEDSINRVAGRAVLQVTGADSGFPEQMLDRVQKVPGVEYAVPVIETNANLAAGTERSFMILGVDVLQDNKIRDYSMNEESADIPDPLLFLAKPDSILLTREMAEREGITIDQKIQVQTVQGNKTFTVRGLLDPEGPARAAGGDFAVMDIYAVQKAFGKEGKIDRIDVSFLRGENLDIVKGRIQAAFPEGYYVDTPAGRTRQVEALLVRYRKSIGLISFMALFVGAYLIYNAVSISAAQRRKEIGILRALGATRGQIMRLFLGETFVISALASLSGIGLGILFAKLTAGVVARTVSDVYLKTSVAELSWSWSGLAANAGIGIIASIAAALFPARSGARTSPISAIRALPYSEDGLLLGKRIKVASLLCIFLSILILVIYKTADSSSSFRSSVTTLSSMVFLLLGVSLSTPVFLKRFLTFVHGYLLSRLGAGGRLAGLNLQKNISRNAAAVAAIFFSIALFVSSANLIHSARKSAFDFFDSIVRTDILVSSGHFMGATGSSNIPMPEGMWEELERVPGVLSAESFRKVYLNYDDKRVLLISFDVARRVEYCPIMVASGSRDDVLRFLPGRNNVAVNESFAIKHRIKHGDSIVLPTPNGPKRFGVAAVIVSYLSDSGVIWMDNRVFQQYWQDRLSDMFELRVKPGASISTVRETILNRFGKQRKLFVMPAQEFKNEMRNLINRSFAVNNAVDVLTLIIASFGIIITLLASVLERTRELGILRSLGMKRSQVSGIVIMESIILGAAGGMLGATAGVLIGWLSLEGFFRLDYGASMAYHIHYASLAWALLLSAGIAALAGLYPAWRAAKTNIAEALAYE